MTFKHLATAAAALSLTIASPVIAAEPNIAIISIYHVAPGQQLAFLKWMDQQDRISAAAGVAKGQLYAHVDGDSWDYLVVNPETTEAEDAALDAAGKKMGVNMMRSGLEMRKYISSHTDTYVRGPMTAADYLGMLGEK